jgi:hypothetical protein
LCPSFAWLPQIQTPRPARNHRPVPAAVSGAFGPMLVVGSGPHKGHTLYYITSDNAPHSYGCTRKVVSVLGSR